MFLEVKKVSARKESQQLILPGQLISKDLQFLNGHGTFRNDGIYSSICGTLKRTNKLIQVKPLKTRFNGEIGDVVIGRILEIQGNRWKVDIKARQDAVLNLSSISLPDGIQRRKTVDDEQEMKSFFKPGDLIVAEVSQFSSEGNLKFKSSCIPPSQKHKIWQVEEWNSIDNPICFSKKIKISVFYSTLWN
jgi:exosome complex component RRP4